MRLKLRINGKMLLYFLGTTVLVYIAALGYISVKIKTISLENSKQNMNAISVELTNDAKRSFDLYMQAASTLATTFTNYENYPTEKRRQFFSEMLVETLKKNPNFLSVWSIWESHTIDSLDEYFQNMQGSTVLGNFRYVYYRHQDSIILSNYIEQDSSEVFNSKIYSRVKNSAAELVAEPYNNSYTQNPDDKILQTNMVAPIIKENRFLGVVGIDVPLLDIQKKFSSITPLGTGKSYIITNQGNFLSHIDTSFLGKSFESYAPEIEFDFNVKEKIAHGENFSFFATEPITGEPSLFVFNPMYIGNCKDAWSFCISVPLKTLYKSANKTFKSTILVGILGLIIVSLVIGIIAFTISSPLLKTTKNLKRIAKGNIDDVEKFKYYMRDEISDIAEAMHNLVSGLKAAANFANEIGKGKLDSEYKLLSSNDTLGNSLIHMQKRLLSAKKEEENKRKEDEKQNWVTHGLASFGEIIRQHNDDMDKFSMNVVKNLMEYTNAAQIAIYINQQIEDDEFSEESYELKAAMAYGKPVMMQKSFKCGEDLLGRAIDEDKYIYLKNIPETYVELSPGMQDKKRPQYLLIVPLTINKLSLGVFELLFYNDIPEHYIEFIEKLSENIASVISSVKTNIRTAKLLEQSQQQADELAQHEEEMRQNLEEMQATQEEAAKRYNSLSSHVKTLNNSLMIAELDKNGRILQMSQALHMAYSLNMEKTKDVFFDSLIAEDLNAKNEFSEFFDHVLKTGIGRRMQTLKRRNITHYYLETYKLIEKKGMTTKVLLLVQDKTKEKELNEQINALS